MVLTVPYPKGPVQQTWYRVGYVDAMADIAAAIERGGLDAAVEWIKNNS